MHKLLKILILEDNPDDLGLIKRELKKLEEKLSIRSADDRSSYIDLLNKQLPDILLSDYKLPDINGKEALDILKKIDSSIPFILVSGTVGEEIATAMILDGAKNFILKDNLKRLVPAINKEINTKKHQPKVNQRVLTRKQEEILKIAIQIISQDSIHKLTIKNITSQMGISEPALYKHFKNKRDILLAILEKYELFFSIPQSDNDSPLHRITTYITNGYNQLEKEPDMGKIILSDTLFSSEKSLHMKMKGILEKFNSHMYSIIEEGQKCGELKKELKSIDKMILGSTRLLITQWCLSNYSFELKKEGIKLCNEIESLIKV